MLPHTGARSRGHSNTSSLKWLVSKLLILLDTDDDEYCVPFVCFMDSLQLWSYTVAIVQEQLVTK